MSDNTSQRTVGEAVALELDRGVYLLKLDGAAATSACSRSRIPSRSAGERSESNCTTSGGIDYASYTPLAYAQGCKGQKQGLG